MRRAAARCTGPALRAPPSQTAPSETRRGLVAGLEDRRVDRAAVGADGQRARRVAEERRRSVSGVPPSVVAEVGGVEHPDVGAADARRGELRRRRGRTFWPRCAVVMKARVPPRPAKTMSRGSSPTSSVRTTRGGVRADVDDADAVGEMVDHPHLAVRCAPRRRPARGRPGPSRSWVSSPLPSTAKISRRSSGVLTANSRVPSGDSASGRTCPLSKVTKAAATRHAGAERALRRRRFRSRGPYVARRRSSWPHPNVPPGTDEAPSR